MDGKELDEKGKEAESFIHQLAERSFFSDWCYPNPVLPNKKELCDLLIVFDDIAVIWQIKNLKIKDGAYDEAEVEKNLRQLSGARRQLFELKTTIDLLNPRRGIERFDPTKIKNVYLISALVGEEQDYAQFMKEYKGKKVHVFSRKFTDVALRELNTIADFTRYLSDKESLLDSNLKIIIEGDEEELLATYLGYGRSFEHLAGKSMVVVTEGGWEDYLKSPRYKKWIEDNRVSRGWDDIINRAHEAKGRYELVAKEMARLSRFERREMSKSYLDAMIQASRAKGCNSFRRIVVSGDVAFCFLFQSKTFSKKDREEILGQICFVTRKLSGKTKVVGIGTELEFEPTCSYSFCLIDIPDWTEELDQKANEMQKRNKILVNVRRETTEGTEFGV